LDTKHAAGGAFQLRVRAGDVVDCIVGAVDADREAAAVLNGHRLTRGQLKNSGRVLLQRAAVNCDVAFGDERATMRRAADGNGTGCVNGGETGAACELRATGGRADENR
jgi:hypothetical protein